MARCLCHHDFSHHERLCLQTQSPKQTLLSFHPHSFPQQQQDLVINAQDVAVKDTRSTEKKPDTLYLDTKEDVLITVQTSLLVPISNLMRDNFYFGSPYQRLQPTALVSVGLGTW